MKKEIRINFRYFWQGFNPEDNFFTNLLKKEYKVIISDNPDYVFYSVYPEKGPSNISGIGDSIKKISPKLYLIARKTFSKVYGFIYRNKKIEGDFVKIFYGSEHVKPKMNECDWAFGSHFEEEINDSRYMRTPMYIVSDYKMGLMAIHPPIKKYMDIEKIKEKKKRFCNFIYSQEVPARNDFFKKLNEYKKVDSPGRCMNNMPPIGADNPLKSRLADNWIQQKLDFIENYKFTIAFENFEADGWITEKLTQPMLVNSIPIYIGDKNVNRDFNTKSFINYHDFKNMDDFIQHIIKVDSDDKLYEEYLRQPWFIDNKINKYYSEKRMMDRFKEIFG